jgi:hypothetical protein
VDGGGGVQSNVDVHAHFFAVQVNAVLVLTLITHTDTLELASLNRFVFSGSFKFYKSLYECCHASIVLLLCQNLVVRGYSLQQFFL